MTLQDISDRLEIQDLQTAYSTAIDTRNWDALDDVFTADAYIDYTAFGGSKGNLAETKAFLANAMPMFSSFQHLVATSQVKLAGDTATARTICHNPMVLDRGKGKTHVFYCGLWYLDEYVRTPQGWRIKKRVEEKSYTHNMPAEFTAPERAMKRRAARRAPKRAKPAGRRKK
jgi:hypothetical protein